MEGIVSTRGQWTSRIGFILAAAGSAIGLGNIWGFLIKQVRMVVDFLF